MLGQVTKLEHVETTTVTNRYQLDGVLLIDSRSTLVALSITLVAQGSRSERQL
jgi:hypothetical protein